MVPQLQQEYESQKALFEDQPVMIQRFLESQANLIADALVVRNVRVQHIISKGNLIMHQLTEFAHVDGTKITYPLYTKTSPQTMLGDFSSFP